MGAKYTKKQLRARVELRDAAIDLATKIEKALPARSGSHRQQRNREMAIEFILLAVDRLD